MRQSRTAVVSLRVFVNQKTAADGSPVHTTNTQPYDFRDRGVQKSEGMLKNCNHKA